MKRSAPPVIFTDDCWIFTAHAGVTAADLKAKVVDGYAGASVLVGFQSIEVRHGLDFWRLF